MKDFTLKFKIGTENISIKRDGADVIDIDYSEGIAISLYYNFDETPLVLRGNASVGDEVVLIIAAAHISLYINDALIDEEWPCGELATDEISCEGIEVIDGVQNPPVYLRKGLTAEELRLPGVNIGDCMPYSDESGDGRYHLFWLYDRHQHNSKWKLGAHQWAHASTTDLVHFDEHPMAIGITEQYEGSICTGSTILADGVYYAWYAIRMADKSPAQMTYAYSTDGDNYIKSGKTFTMPEKYHGTSARDPKIVFFDGKYHMMITTTLMETGNGCLAHLVSAYPDMRDYEDLGPIMEWHTKRQPECPDYFEMNGYYYLVWSISGLAHYAYSKTPFGMDGWTVSDENILDCGRVPKSAICPWNGERVFAGFIRENNLYGGHLVLKTVKSLPDGHLFLI